MSHYHSRSFVFTRAEHVVLKPIIKILLPFGKRIQLNYELHLFHRLGPSLLLLQKS